MINEANTLDLDDLDDIQDPIIETSDEEGFEYEPSQPDEQNDDFDLAKELLTL